MMVTFYTTFIGYMTKVRCLVFNMFKFNKLKGLLYIVSSMNVFCNIPTGYYRFY